MKDWKSQEIWDAMIGTYIREGQRLAADGHQPAANDRFYTALDVLVRSYQQAVVGFCLHLLGRQAAEAEDLAQEVFLAAWRTMPHFRHEAGLRTWVFAIARRHCWDALKRADRSHVRVAARRRLSEDTPDPTPPPQEQHEQQDFLAWVKQGLAQLPSEDREVLVMTYMAELPPAEMAQLLGIEEASVRTRRRRALQRLREIVADEPQRTRRVPRG
jgi:RNA polymerase sigma-70 factor (ECF subfamily)